MNGSLRQKFYAALLAVVVVIATSQPVKAQAPYVEGDLGSFVSYVCQDLPSTNLAQVLEDVLNQLRGLRASLGQIGSDPGGIGDPAQCLPGFHIFDLPSLPGVGDLAACFDLGAYAGIGSAIGSCMGGVLSSFPDLEAYFSQYELDWQQLTSCLQGLVTPATLSIPDFLEQLTQTLNNLIAILQSAQVSLPTYRAFHAFFLDFCEHHYSASGGVMSGTWPGYSSTVSQTGGALSMSTVMIGGSSSAFASAPPTVYAQVKGPGGTKKYPLALRAGKYAKKVRLGRRGNYAITIYVMQGTIPAAITYASVKY